MKMLSTWNGGLPTPNDASVFNFGGQPYNLAFDGTNIWAAYSDGNLRKIRASDGTLLGTFARGGNGARFIAFDGFNIWVTNPNENTVTKVRASDGADLGGFPVGAFPNGIAFDGTSVWVANLSGGSVSKR